MRWNRIWLLVAALLVASLFGGMVTQEAQAQAYDVNIDFALQRSYLLGQDIIVLGNLTVVGSRAGDDTVSVTVSSPDPNISPVVANIFISETTTPGEFVLFAVQQITFVGGDFSVIVTSSLEGTILPTTNYPVPNYDVDVRISSVTGEVGTQFLVTTTVDVGNMSEILTRFDIEYVLDGVPLRQSNLVTLFGDTLASISEGTVSIVILTQPEAGKSWEATQGFSLAPGSHTLQVSVVDRSVAVEMFTTSFGIQVSDQIAGLETRVDELDLELGTQIDELSGRTDSAAQAASAANTLAGSVVALSLGAIGLSVLTLLIQFGILKLGRLRRGPQVPPEPQEPQE
ncbi:MAG: hypothetical protein LN413_01750 [Candidatus Thermoplasmatota archaeon]|nr:hypothetical protein [Candidatus Thermoplasmatota archaeon]